MSNNVFGVRPENSEANCVGMVKTMTRGVWNVKNGESTQATYMLHAIHS